MREKNSYTEAKLLKLISPSPLRQEPHCEYHSICGGCSFGHIRYESQIEIKKRFVNNALRKWEQRQTELEVISADALDYRIRASFRIKNGEAGFFEAGSNDFVPVKNCPVVKASLFDKVCRWAKETTSETELLTLAVIENEEGRALARLSSKKPLTKEYSAGPFEYLATEGDNTVALTFATAYGPVAVAPGGFFQSNRFLNLTFQKCAVQMAEGAYNITELYAGSGFFTTGLMSLTDKVKGYELDRRAVELGRYYDYPLYEKDAASVITSGVDTLFMDPPREGLAKSLLKKIIAAKPRRIIYVSCNPMTLARDLAPFNEDYTVKRRVLADMFPHTYHTESLHLLEKK